MLGVSFQGERGAYSEAAAVSFFSKAEIEDRNRIRRLQRRWTVRYRGLPNIRFYRLKTP